MNDDNTVVRSLEEIITDGYKWHDGLSTIVVDLCKRVKVLEDKK